MVLDPKRIEVIDDAMAAMLRAKTGPERLRMTFGMFRMARRLVLSNVRASHPDWDEQQVLREAARRISHGAV